jgi:hypothetical protein
MPIPLEFLPQKMITLSFRAAVCKPGMSPVNQILLVEAGNP